MRLIGTLEDERQAQAFSQFLLRKGIDHQIEIEKETNWDSPSYGTSHCHVWIVDEEHLAGVSEWFKGIASNPQDPIFRSLETPSNPLHAHETPPAMPTPLPKQAQATSAWEKQPIGWITKTILGMCCLLFFLSQFLMPSHQVPAKYAGLILFSSPVEKVLLFDYPTFYELINRLIKRYGYEELEHPDTLPPEGQRLLQQINQTPFWPGYYQLLLKGGWQTVKTGLSDYPTFEKIREGQVWRLFSPCLLHADLFHIFFNMLWLIILGKQMEQRLSAGRYAFFILSMGIVSNTAQYLSSGPNFIGFSGILCGMLAFIWMRQRRAAWEGYQIDRMTMIFMLVFILSMAGIQLLSFALEKSLELAFSPNIANMAHLSGGIMGFLFGRFEFFRWRHR